MPNTTSPLLSRLFCAACGCDLSFPDATYGTGYCVNLPCWAFWIDADHVATFLDGRSL